MITEEQRRALFALREALHLCEVSKVRVESTPGYGGEQCLSIELNRESWFAFRAEHVDEFLAEHPEP